MMSRAKLIPSPLHGNKHCVKRVRIRNYSGLHFPAFGLNTYSDRMRENADQKISEYAHFLRSEITLNQVNKAGTLSFK